MFVKNIFIVDLMKHNNIHNMEYRITQYGAKYYIILISDDDTNILIYY